MSIAPTPRPRPAKSEPRRLAAPVVGEEPIAVRPVGRGKRAFDVTCAAVMLAAFAPVMAVAMALVRATSRGPAIYTQVRVGRGGKTFTIYKIRTMAHECESLTGARWSMPGDPRITPLGHWLRRLHIDELPQLINVLKGEMSLLGPRPERPEMCKDLRKAVRGYDRRHAVLPGITGFAQIHLPPDTSVRSVRDKVTYDLFAIRHGSARLGLFVLVATGLKVLHLNKLYQRPARRGR